MPPEPSEAEEWLAYAREDLVLAQVAADNAYARGLRAYHCQQTAEKAIKAVLEHHGLTIPRTHHIASLFDRVPDEVPDEVAASKRLSVYASAARYPDDILEIDATDLAEALELAIVTLDWARRSIS